MTCAITLKSADLSTAVGRRIFNVNMQGSSVISNPDIYIKIGNYKLFDVIINISVSNGTLSLTFVGTVGNAIINGIVVTAN